MTDIRVSCCRRPLVTLLTNNSVWIYVHQGPYLCVVLYAFYTIRYSIPSISSSCDATREIICHMCQPKRKCVHWRKKGKDSP